MPKHYQDQLKEEYHLKGESLPFIIQVWQFFVFLFVCSFESSPPKAFNTSFLTFFCLFPYFFFLIMRNRILKLSSPVLPDMGYHGRPDTTSLSCNGAVLAVWWAKMLKGYFQSLLRAVIALVYWKHLDKVAEPAEYLHFGYLDTRFKRHISRNESF